MALRNLLFSWGIFQQGRVGVPVISVGNLSVGGTGKTPHVAYIVDALKDEFQLAILLRGYGRNTKGFVKVTTHSSSDSVGDEALLYKRRFGHQVEVVVCENRLEGARRLLEFYPTVNCIVLDDAYQHRAIARDCNILLEDVNHLSMKDVVLPAGNLREFAFGRNRADLVVLTKLPEGLSEENETAHRNSYPAQVPIFSSRIVYGQIKGIHGQSFDLPAQIVLVTGIAKADGLKQHLQKIAPVHHVEFSDHHEFTTRDIQGIHEIFGKFASNTTVIITTEKDAMRLIQPQFVELIANHPWFIQEMDVKIHSDRFDFIQEIKRHLC
jgi:tetraacyldisaccharide 4'-kinase